MSTESSLGDEELDLPPMCGLMILKIIIVNILLSLGDQISDFLQVSSDNRFNVVIFQAFNLLFLTWISDGRAQDWDEYWDEK